MGWITRVYSDVYSTALMQDSYWTGHGRDAAVPAMERVSVFQRLFRRG